MIVAVKIIKKEAVKRENFLEQLIREIKIQSFLSHVNLLKMYAFFHDALNVYLILELCPAAISTTSLGSRASSKKRSGGPS